MDTNRLTAPAPLRLPAPLRWALPALLSLGCLLASAESAPQWQPQRTLYPIGGGYEEALKGFSREVIKQARGTAVRMLMVPAAFADDPVLPEDPAILAEDVELLRQACEAVVNRTQFPQGCVVGSVPLYVAADAHAPEVLRGLNDQRLDGIFFTGGDQGYAMKILANTESEAAMKLAAKRGVVFGGTSAGGAVQSLAMNAGYTDASDSTTGLQKGAIDLWLGHPDPNKRGLVFGSRKLVVDAHVYSRGRLGRMLNAGAQTVDRLGQGGLLGLGMDYDTGVSIHNDSWLGPVSGVSSGIVVDFRSAGARHRWVGPKEALSARQILTHVLPPSSAVGFDLEARMPTVSGRRLPWTGRGWDAPQWFSRQSASLILSGDISDDLGGPVLGEFVRQANRQPLGTLWVVAAGYGTPADAQTDLGRYSRALSQAGWRGQTRTLIQGQSFIDPAQARDASGVLLLGGSQALLKSALTDVRFRDFVRHAGRSARVVMTERAMTAAAGEAFNAIDEPASEDDAIAAFKANNAVLRPGLGLVQGAAFEPRLQADKRWGRLYGIGARARQLAVVGISEASAIVMHAGLAQVLGQNPVVTLDARSASFLTGDNGALGAFNVLLDVYEPGERIGR